MIKSKVSNNLSARVLCLDLLLICQFIQFFRFLTRPSLIFLCVVFLISRHSITALFYELEEDQQNCNNIKPNNKNSTARNNKFSFKNQGDNSISYSIRSAIYTIINILKIMTFNMYNTVVTEFHPFHISPTIVDRLITVTI